MTKAIENTLSDGAGAGAESRSTVHAANLRAREGALL